MMTLWDIWDFKSEFAMGMIDQRIDEIESVDVIVRSMQPVLRHFPPDRLLLTSECGFQHVLEITRGKLRSLVDAATHLRTAETGRTLI
jgi:methionine synthase II (cobalamin-independent)